MGAGSKVLTGRKLVLSASLICVSAVIAAFLVLDWRGEDGEEGDGYCWGLLTEQALSGGISSDASIQQSDFSVLRSSCAIRAGDDQVLEVKIGVTGASWAYSARSRNGARSVYNDYTPIGGETAGLGG